VRVACLVPRGRRGLVGLVGDELDLALDADCLSLL